MAIDTNFDAIVPSEMAKKAELVGVKKVTLPFMQMFLLSVLAGAFIAVGAIFATIVSADAGNIPYGIVKLLTGLVFSVGLILVVIGGAELFTGNNLIVMAFVSGKVTLLQLLRNWVVVYFGNFIGSILTAVIMLVTQQYTFGKGQVGLNALNIANAKCSLSFFQAVALGIMCNALVCLAVWLCFSARSTTDKILAIIFPITAFVAAGFEHSVANMFFIPMGLLIKNWGNATFFSAISKIPSDFPNLTWEHFFSSNLIPVTIGNIIGGAVMVGLIYWAIYSKESKG